MKVCIRHIVRPKSFLPADGCGDCTVCVPDELNENCRRYVPVTLYGYEVSPVTPVEKTPEQN